MKLTQILNHPQDSKFKSPLVRSQRNSVSFRVIVWERSSVLEVSLLQQVRPILELEKLSMTAPIAAMNSTKTSHSV